MSAFLVAAVPLVLAALVLFAGYAAQRVRENRRHARMLEGLGEPLRDLDAIAARGVVTL